LCVLFEFVDHGGCRGNTVQALAQWRHQVADLPAFFVSPLSADFLKVVTK
jgi:hypothetical protein